MTHSTGPGAVPYTVNLAAPVRRWPVRAFNGYVARFPSRRARFALSADALLDLAVGSTGLANFGDPAFMTGLRALVDAINATARLNDFGQFAWHGMLHTLLRNRLFVEEKLRREPALAGRAIAEPLFVFGLPRTGSTFLHILLASDPAARFLSAADALQPQPDPRRRPLPAVLQRANARFSFGLLDYLAPGFKVIHDEPVAGPAECGALLLHTFTTVAFLPSLDIPEYAQWLRTADYGPAAAYHRRQVGILDARRPGGRWVLKSPAHLPMVDALIRHYPGARFVFLHRDPAKVVPSFCSLVGLTRGLYSDALDGRQIGTQTAAMLNELLRGAVEARRRHDPTRFVDVSYAELTADPAGAVAGIYRHCGWEMSDTLRAHLHRHVQASRTGRHRHHRYGPEAFGLDAGALREQFGWYVQAFDVAPEG